MLKESEIKALVKLLDDEDYEIVSHVEEKIKSIGTGVIPFLEKQWETSFNPFIQEKIEDLVHELQFELLKERFIEWKEKDQKNLLNGLWIVSTYLYPDLNQEDLNTKINLIYHELRKKLEEKMTPYNQIKIFNDVFFNTFKFHANTKNFHSPTNSMINAILESKKGNPILLCSIYLLLAQKLKLPIYGVNLPNLFILTYQTEDESFYINVFNGGLIFTLEDIYDYLENLHLDKNNLFYKPCSHLDIILRVLRNLLVSFEKLGDYHKADEIKILLHEMDDNYLNL